MIGYIISALAGYLSGSVNSAVIISRGLGRGDVRSYGSGNAGATNMARVYGMRAGALVLAGDMLKTLLAVAIGRLLCGEAGVTVSGCACIVGHCYPCFCSFRGGKGVSVAGVLGFCVDWRVGLAVTAAFVIGAFGSKKVSVGSLSGAVVMIVSSFVLAVPGWKLALALTAALLVIFRHWENIRRLINGTEPDFRAGGN